jgi:hypothetical protein
MYENTSWLTSKSIEETAKKCYLGYRCIFFNGFILFLCFSQFTVMIVVNVYAYYTVSKKTLFCNTNRLRFPFICLIY